jgi:hypothetical protein
VLLANAPTQIQLPFANGDSSKTNPVPVPSQISITPGAASFTDGFPPLCATPVSSGGIPPSKADMDGILFMLSAVDRWSSAGAGFPWSSGFSAAISGYPKGSRVLNATGTGYWLSATDNNTTNPDTGGAGWVATWRTASSVYAASPQTVNAGVNKVLFDTIEFDSSGQWDATNKRFKAAISGIYRVGGNISMPGAPGQDITVLILKNGTIARVGIQLPQVSTVDLTFPFSTMLQMTANDYVEVFLDLAINTTVSFGPPNVVFQFEFLGN